MTSYDYSKLSLLREYLLFLMKMDRAMTKLSMVVVGMTVVIVGFIVWYLTVGVDIYSRM